MAGGRMRRVDEGVKQVLSETIPTLKDPRIGFVTVTAVETTTDLDHAKVWISVLGSEKQREATMRALEGAAGVLQAAINRDYTLVMGVTIFYGFIIILCNLAADLAYGLLDPKVRYD